MSFWKNIGNTFLYYHRAASLLIKGKKNKNFLFHPELPSKRTTIFKIANYLGYNITNNPYRKFTLAFNWENKTFSERTALLENIASHTMVINQHCLDISKTMTSDVFEQVFGYPLMVNPETYEGQVLAKSNFNAVKDGYIKEAPFSEKENNKVYQVLINNYDEQNVIYDIRVPVISENIPFVYVKYKKTSERFTNAITSIYIDSAENLFNKEEIKKIIQFSKKMGMDFGELDVLRDFNSDKIYIVDVNSTSWGPHPDMDKESQRKLIRLYSDTFYKSFLEDS